MNTRPFIDIRTSSTFLSIALCALLGLAIACGGSADSPAAESPQPTTTVSDEAPDPTALPDEEPEPTASDSSDRNWNILGSPDALVTVLDYSDFQ